MVKMKAPVVSVLLPVYNCERYLGCAIESILGQTLGDLELIVVDDGSTDGSVEIARLAARADDRVRVIERGRAGLVGALNAGLDAARAPLVARMDADDVSLPARLEKQTLLLRERPELALVSCLVGSFSDGEVGEGMLVYEKWLNSLVTDEEIARDFFVESPFAHPSVTYRRSAVIEAGGYVDWGWPEDYELWLRLRERGARFAKAPEKLFLWRDYPERLSRTGRAYSVVAFRNVRLHYLLKSYLRDRRAVTIWGAGRAGRWWRRELLIAGIDARRFIDVDPGKVGRSVAGAPVVGVDALKKRVENDLILACVGSRGAREKIRSFLIALDYVELEDFLMLA